MADICDMASDRIESEAHLQGLIAAQRANTRELHPNGICHNPLCGLEVLDSAGQPSPTKLFCDATCSAEFETVKRSGGRRGS